MPPGLGSVMRMRSRGRASWPACLRARLSLPAALSPPASSSGTSAAPGTRRSLFTSALATACTWWSARAGCGSSRTGCGSPSPSSTSVTRSGLGATLACSASPCTRTSRPTATSTCSTSSTPTTCSRAATPRTATTPRGTSISTPRLAGSPASPRTLPTTGRRSSPRAASCSWARRRARASPSCTSRTAWAPLVFGMDGTLWPAPATGPATPLRPGQRRRHLFPARPRLRDHRPRPERRCACVLNTWARCPASCSAWIPRPATACRATRSGTPTTPALSGRGPGRWACAIPTGSA